MTHTFCVVKHCNEGNVDYFEYPEEYSTNERIEFAKNVGIKTSFGYVIIPPTYWNNVNERWVPDCRDSNWKIFSKLDYKKAMNIKGRLKKIKVGAKINKLKNEKRILSR